MGDSLDFYATPGPLTVLDRWEAALAGMPTDPVGVAEVAQGLVVHVQMTALYGVDLPVEREWEAQTRATGDVVRLLLERDARPLVEARPPADRFLGNCRHFSTLTVALLRRAGIPSRARCGFAGYFEPGKWVDHWVVEHWDGTRWVTLDAQVDPVQRELFALTADPTDLPSGLFLRAGEAWQRCRRGEEDGDRFGILDMWGKWFIPGNVARDLAALNKVEVLPWDGWGAGLAGADEPPDALVDEVAALTLSDDLAAIRARYTSDPDLEVPSRVLAFATPAGPREAEIPELA